MGPPEVYASLLSRGNNPLFSACEECAMQSHTPAPQEEILNDVARDGRVLLQAPHRVAVPGPPVGDVDAKAMAGGNEAAAQGGRDAEQHLEFVSLAGKL